MNDPLLCLIHAVFSTILICALFLTVYCLATIVHHAF